MSQKQREYHLKRTYGITLDQYAELLERQGGGCGVCGKTPEEEGRNLAVEHDHGTREIVGLCCMRCNHRLLGRIRDPELFEKAAKYLRGGTGWFVPPKPKRRRRTTRKRK